MTSIKNLEDVPYATHFKSGNPLPTAVITTSINLAHVLVLMQDPPTGGEYGYEYL